MPTSAEVIAACSRLIDKTTVPVDRAWAFTLRARAKSDQGDLAGAVSDCNSALALRPTYDSALGIRAGAYERLENYALALRDSTEAISLKPDDAEYYNIRGLTYRELGEPAKALADLDQAIKLMPDYPTAFNNRGITYKDLGQPDRAIEDFKQAIKLSPNYVLAYYNLGEVENDVNGDYDKAIADLSTALKLNPGLGAAYLNRGIAYASDKEHRGGTCRLQRSDRQSTGPAGSLSRPRLAFSHQRRQRPGSGRLRQGRRSRPAGRRGAIRTRRRENENRR